MADTKVEILEIWAQNLIKRILKEMRIQEISPDNPDYKGSGKLQESIDFAPLDRKIFNAAGGDDEKITFFYEYYGLFVELGTQKGQPYSKEKLSKPFYSGRKYASKKAGVRPPKPFLFGLVNQRVYSLQMILERVVTENITTTVVSTLSMKEKKEKSSDSREGFWRKYAKVKGR